MWRAMRSACCDRHRRQSLQTGADGGTLGIADLRHFAHHFFLWCERSLDRSQRADPFADRNDRCTEFLKPMKFRHLLLRLAQRRRRRKCFVAGSTGDRAAAKVAEGVSSRNRSDVGRPLHGRNLTTFVTLGIMERFGELSLLLLCYRHLV